MTHLIMFFNKKKIIMFLKLALSFLFILNTNLVYAEWRMNPHTNKLDYYESTANQAPKDATYITQTANATLTAEQALANLATGLLKNTTITGILSIATAGTDYENPLTFSSPLSRSINTISIPVATALADGYLDKDDFLIFSGKEDVLSFTSPLTRVTNTIALAGLSGLGTANQLIGMDATATFWEYKILSAMETDPLYSAWDKDYNDLTNKPTLPSNETGAANNFLTAYNSTTGIFSKAQPTFANLASTPTTLAGYGITDAQPLDADLTSIASLGFTSTSFLKKTAIDTWVLDPNTYIITEADPITGAINGIIKADGAGNISEAIAGTDYLSPSSTVDEGEIVFILGDSVNAITTADDIIAVPTPCDGTITRWEIVSVEGTSGSIVVDIQKATDYTGSDYASIAGSEKPTLSSATSNTDTSLTTWTTSISAGNWFKPVIESVATVKRVVVAVYYTKT